jgi:cullin-associated NEDD8-dissociated protein 1
MFLPFLALSNVQIDRHEDMLRSCLRAVDAVYRIPGAMNGPAFSSFMKRVVLGGNLKDRFAAVQKEREEAEVGAADAMDMS